MNILEQITHRRKTDTDPPVGSALPSSPTSFSQAIKQNSPTAIIAEIKRAVPRTVDGKLVSVALWDEGGDKASTEDFSSNLAKAYQEAGASCISVLTEPHWFKGSPQAFAAARQATTIPLLRKDFITNHRQIHQSADLGADAVLLIVAAMPISLAKELEALAFDLKMEVLAEVHNSKEMELALSHLKTPLVGVNNRNLKTLKISLDTTKQLAPEIKRAGKICIAESGISEPYQIKQLAECGADGFLIGKSLMETKDPATTLRALLEQVR